VSSIPLQSFKERNPDFPEDQLLEGNFFELEGQFELIFEQTFFCSFEPTKELRGLYADKMASLLKRGGKLVGLWFNHPLVLDADKRPYGGSKDEYLSYLTIHLHLKIFDDCYNSIESRIGQEYFGIFEKI